MLFSLKLGRRACTECLDRSVGFSVSYQLKVQRSVGNHFKVQHISKFADLRSQLQVKGATSRFWHLEKFSLNFSSSSFVIRVNLLHR